MNMNYPLSPSIKKGNLLFVSGQIGQKDGKLVSDILSEQLKQAIDNVVTILKQNNLELKNVVEVTAFLVNAADYVEFNDIYSKNFVEPYPARTTVVVSDLPLSAKVELKVIAHE